MKISRRHFILMGFLSAPAIFALGRVRIMQTSAIYILALKIKRHFFYLNVPFSESALFAKRHLESGHFRGYRLLAAPLEESLLSRFLMSMDFFTHAADENRQLSFVAYYDPYLSPCYNPFLVSERGEPVYELDQVADGQRLYEKNCTACHQGGVAPDLTGLAEKYRSNPKGISEYARNPKGAMPKQSHLSDGELDKIKDYIFSFDKN